MRPWWCPIVALAAAACGDNVYPDNMAIEPASDLTIIAHQDDDLLFMQPDLYEAVVRGDGVTNVYVTAGNGRGGFEESEPRYDGLMAAYGTAAGDRDWTCGWTYFGANVVEHCRLAHAKVSLIFLGYPDGGISGEASDSLLHLWEGTASRARAVTFAAATFDRPTLIAVLAEIIDRTAPTTLRTLDIAATHGHDHSDHMIAGALAVLATAQSSIAPELISYRGYNVADDPYNADLVLYQRSLGPLAHYEACADGCAPCGGACTSANIIESHLRYLRRRYAIGVRRRAEGKLRLEGRCLAAAVATGASASLVDCASAPGWHLDPRGTLRTDDGLCLQAQPTGDLVAATACGSDPSTRFFFDDEGHLWSGIPPEPAADMSFAHLDCVVAEGDHPRTALCGAGRAPRWELARTTTTTPRASTLLTRTGRAVRMLESSSASPPALCAVETAGLLCARSTASGALTPAVRIDSPSAPLAVEPDSLVVGDIDGDGEADACGRDAGGLLCATAASSYQAERWSPMLASSGPAGPTDRSLAIAPGGKICGLADAGVVCISRGTSATPDVRSTWPDRTAALWIGDLDGDGDPDWCAATPRGPACSLAHERTFTTRGISWGYATGGRIEASATEGALPDTATAVVTDIDGDGRDDLCTARDGAIACARSLSHGFAPSAPVVRLPDGMQPVALWAEPSKAPGVPRLCAADATTIACTDR